MRISLESLAVLDAIDRRGSFAAAADEMHRVPSAITYSVNKLEQDLGITLFDRSGHRAELTAAGREMLEAGRHLLRAAAGLENRIRRMSTGWEAELRVAVGDLINMPAILDIARRFYGEESGTRLRISEEVYGGTWDALVSDRADLVIGAPANGPAGGGYSTQPIGEVEFVFAVAPDHPLAGLPEPLKGHDIQRYRSVSAADSSRYLPPRTAGLLSGQEVLAVPNMFYKQLTQRLGLGVGFLPAAWVEQDVARNRLVIKRVEENRESAVLVSAWRTGHGGRALAWFLEKLRDKERLRSLCASPWMHIN